MPEQPGGGVNVVVRATFGRDERDERVEDAKVDVGKTLVLDSDMVTVGVLA